MIDKKKLMPAISSEEPSILQQNIPTSSTVENSNNATSTHSPALTTSSLVTPTNSHATNSHLAATTHKLHKIH